MFKHDTMEQYVADSLAASSAEQSTTPPGPEPDFGVFDFFGPRTLVPSTSAQVIPFPCLG